MGLGYTEHEYEGIKSDPNDSEFDTLVDKFYSLPDEIVAEDFLEEMERSLKNDNVY
jgi:hypothetical protein